MGRVHLVITKAARDRKILAGNVRFFRQGPCGHRRALASQDQSPRTHRIECIAPARGPCLPAAFVRLLNLLEEGFLDRRRVGGLLHEVDVMDVAGWMKLRHVERVHVPELILDQRPSHFLKAHADELGLHQIQKLPVGMLFAHRDAGGAQADRIFAEANVEPAPVLQHLGRELSLGDFSAESWFSRVIRARHRCRGIAD